MYRSFIRPLWNFFRNKSARQHPVRSFCKLLHLQAWHRITGSPWRFRLNTGLYALAYPHSSGITAYYYFGLPDFHEQNFILDHIERSELFIDIGANVGGWTLLVAGKGTKVLAFEPIPDSFERLKENISLNPQCIQSVNVYNVGLSSEKGTLSFTADLDTGNTVISDPESYSGNKINVGVTPIDEYTMDCNPSYIKIDVEGHELEVIKGSRKTLEYEGLKALIIETYRWANYKKPELKEMEKVLRSYGFLPFRYNVETKRLIERKRKSEGGQNTIYARPKFFNLN